MFGIKVTSVLQTLLWLLIRIGLLGLCLWVGLLVLSFFPATDQQALNYQPPAGRATLSLLVAWSVTGLVALYKLVAVAETVGKGDPFGHENADRLRWIAWAVFIGEGLEGAMQWVNYELKWDGASLRGFYPGGGSILWSLTIVLLFFALARVFEQGTHMREEIGEMI